MSTITDGVLKISSKIDMHALFPQILKSFSESLPVDYVLLIINKNGKYFVSARHSFVESDEPILTLCALHRFSNNLQKAATVAMDSRRGVALEKKEMEGPEQKMILAYPLLYGEKPLGVVVMEGKNLTSELMLNYDERFRAFAQASVTAIENARLIRRLRIDSLRKMRSEIQLSKSLMRISDLETALNFAAMVIYTDEKGIITDVNEDYCRLSEYSHGELMGRSLNFIRRLPDEDEKIPEILDVLKSRQTWHGEIPNIQKGGEPFWIEAAIIPVLGNNQAVRQLILIGFDITRRKQTEDMLRHSQKLDALGQLTGGIAHDFNNILGIILGNLDLLERLLKGNQVYLRKLNAAQNAAERGSDLIRRLLVFASRQTLTPQIVQVNSLIYDLMAMLQRTLGKDVFVETNLGEDLPLSFIDPREFENAFINLVINSRDAMPEGGVLLIATKNVVVDSVFSEQLGGIVPGEYVEFSICDNGKGMSALTQEQIFEPFFTTHGPGKGTGLGLSMVYGFVKQSKGHIQVYSKENFGTVFKLYLPAYKNENESAITDQALSYRTRGIAGYERVLLVDDEEDILGVLEANLSELGYRLKTAANADEALAILAEDSEFSLIISDVIMPGSMDGIGLFNVVKEKYPDIEVILSSGFPARANDMTEWSVPEIPILSKPYKFEDLTKLIRNVLDKIN